MITHLQYPSENQVSGVLPREDVAYSCGSCGYALNLRSSNRNTSNIDSKYRKALRKGSISFLSIDESKFAQIDELKCLPYFLSKHSWGFLRPRTKLLCRKCSKVIDHAYERSISPLGSASNDSSPETGMVMCKKYIIKIRALQPSEETNLPLIA